TFTDKASDVEHLRNTATVTINVTVPPPAITANPSTVQQGNSVTAAWTGIVNPTPKDWIGLYSPGAANSSFLSWFYVSCSQTPDVPRASGNCNFGIPGGLASGNSDLRVLANDGFTALATSNPITV